MEFEVRMTAQVENPDVDIMSAFENAIMDRFAGTAIKVSDITMMPKRSLVAPALRDQLTGEDWAWVFANGGSDWKLTNPVTLPSGLILNPGEITELWSKR